MNESLFSNDRKFNAETQRQRKDLTQRGKGAKWQREKRREEGIRLCVKFFGSFRQIFLFLCFFASLHLCVESFSLFFSLRLCLSASLR
jgi:hypothetical protein